MNFKSLKNRIILGILFLLPVIFLLFLYPSTNNYNALDIVKTNVSEISNFKSDVDGGIKLEGNLTVLGFLGKNPNERALPALNLKEVIYDKFKGFKRFQVVILVPNGSESQVNLLEKELYQFDELKYWRFAYGHEEEILNVFKSLNSNAEINKDLATDHVFIIDKERNQRGRLDDRDNKEKEKNSPVYPLYSYDCIEVAILKNKMASEDMRVLFTEYRQKRKGNFNTDSRREQDLKGKNEEI
ncbi:MAG: hypothetical protein HKO81_10170 [Flavobacteriaceae bacterium]|nr:hypothetical protein [Bacteroidia bacterium]NNL16992.1 hypothetical protein [Flavobacteriaceae bacterium]